jgi:hypothetical protein
LHQWIIPCHENNPRKNGCGHTDGFRFHIITGAGVVETEISKCLNDLATVVQILWPKARGFKLADDVPKEALRRALLVLVVAPKGRGKIIRSTRKAHRRRTQLFVIKRHAIILACQRFL